MSANSIEDSSVEVLPLANQNTNFPGWVLNPERPGYIMVVGSAPKQRLNPALQERVVLVQARTELSKQLKLWIEDNTTVSTQQDQDGKVTRSYDRRGTQISSQLLNINGARIFNRFTDADGTLYILYGMPVGSN
jgi:hypothetical protein